METIRFDELNLDPRILRAVTDMGFEAASPIQAQAIPVEMEGHDMIGQAQTGTGKTAAFGIPLLMKMDLTQSGILKPEGEKAPAAPAATANGPQGKEESKNPAQFTRIYQFSSLDLVCEAARQTGAVFKGNSVLYKNPENGVFYLILKKENDSESSFNRVCNTLSEYGTRLKGDAAASGAYYAEHYDLIVKKDALKVLQNL